jgi:hypothetical protein
MVIVVVAAVPSTCVVDSDVGVIESWPARWD